MCYMESIGIRELRQNASRYLARVAGGESLEITNHGHVVARLVPPVQRPPTWEELIANGTVTPGRGSILDVDPVKPPPGTPSTREILDDLRGDS